MNASEVDYNQVTPMMQQYLDIKRAYPDCILFYRLGDFYEMFFDDAETASRELELTLTGKNCGLPERAPMCGVPYHAVDSYLTRMVSKGYKVAICEQVEDPRLARGIVRREVIRIVTPGTNLDTQSLDESRNNYILCVVCLDSRFGLAASDVTTGDFSLTEVETERRLLSEIGRYRPAEILTNEAFRLCVSDADQFTERFGTALTYLDAGRFDETACVQELTEQFGEDTVSAIDPGKFGCGKIAAGALLKYLKELQKTALTHLSRLEVYAGSAYMVLDPATRRNLELTETLREKEKRGTLLWVIDKTKTAMGARMLRGMIEQPLVDAAQITGRLDAVEALCQNLISREEIREYLTPVYDLERLVSKVVYQTANPRDLIAFRTSLAMLPAIKTVLSDFSAPVLTAINEALDPLEDLCSLIEHAIVEDPPISVREGGIIREGFDPEADRLRSARMEGKQWIAKLEEEEREKTGIKNLRIRFNRVFGYYLEVTNSYRDLVPDTYTRKQTLANAERFITPELKNLEDTILGSEERLVALEYDLFVRVRDEIASQVERIQRTARAVAAVDVFASLATVATRNGYVRPSLNEDGVIEIREGRHPVVEQMMRDDRFIANDMRLDGGENRVAIITGPNMAGKSTYMRQNALIVLMAQIGSFVPASEANIGLVDRIFTRVGASDDLASGQSTFMVEMNEVANILENATPDSLLILDEIGRGTSTIDGLSIAWAVVEYISDPKILGAKTLFATHYHELTELEGRLPGVHNFRIAVKERGDDIVFLRKIVPGGADKSYGIQVARLAGLPEKVLSRAKVICEELECADVNHLVDRAPSERATAEPESPFPDDIGMGQMSLFDTVRDDDIVREIAALDLQNLTPFEALHKLLELQNKINNRWQG